MECQAFHASTSRAFAGLTGTPLINAQRDVLSREMNAFCQIQKRRPWPDYWSSAPRGDQKRGRKKEAAYFMRLLIRTNRGSLAGYSAVALTPVGGLGLVTVEPA